ncbi:15684_t:CDS:2, partial [Dentiscutata erythropus]
NKNRREFLLRLIAILIFIGVLLWLSINKILIISGAIQAEPLVSMSIDNLTTTGFPIWSGFICSQNLTGITVETLKRGGNKGNGTETDDEATLLPDSYISRTDTNALTTGDWTLMTGIWPCFYFNNSNKDYKFIPGIVDQLIIVALVDGNQSKVDNGLLFGVFDDIRPLNVIEPFNAGIPSINTYTFTLTERVDVNKKEHLYFTVNKQNYHSITFQNGSIAARFLYSPDTYLAVKYVETPQYTINDLISATG